VTERDFRKAEDLFQQAIINSDGNQRLISYAEKRLREIGGTIVKWEVQEPTIVYFNNQGEVTLERPSQETVGTIVKWERPELVYFNSKGEATLEKPIDIPEKQTPKKEKKGGLFGLFKRK
jgi:hypothetical protein